MKLLSPKYACQVATHYKRQLHRYLLRRLDKPQNVDDLARELYLQLPRINDLAREVYLRLPPLDNADYRRNPLGYVYRIAENVLNDWKEVERRAGHVTADREQIDRPSESTEAACPDDPE
jgi:DNA-directed RNA polymerase specialized sigma24 family protein